MTAIIDYDAGNMRSVEKALRALGNEPVITRDRNRLLSADHVILPGVGAYKDCMGKLEEYGLCSVIKEIADRGIPFLGICLGMQLLFDSSEEGRENGQNVKGLGLLKGRIIRIPKSADPDSPGHDLKIPHMGWNSLDIKPDSRLLASIKNGSYVYFVHSYYLKADDENTVVATCEYGTHIHAAVESGNLFGCQFHPEKSSDTGLKILKNFLSI